MPTRRFMSGRFLLVAVFLDNGDRSFECRVGTGSPQFQRFKLSRFKQRLFFFFLFRAEAHEERQDRRAGHCQADHEEHVVPFHRALEQEACRNRTGVAARANDPGNRAQRLLVDEGHHRIGRAFRHLGEQREDDQHRQRQEQHGHLRKDHKRDAFAQEHHEQPERAALQAPELAEVVAEDAAERAREDVHQAEAGRHTARSHQAEIEVIEEIQCRGVVDRQLDAETGRIDQKQQPDAIVAHRPEIGPGHVFLLVHLALGAQVFEIAVWGVLREVVVGDAGQEDDHAHNHHGKPPALRVGEAKADHEHRKHHRHGKLRNTATEVAPARRGGVGRAHHVGREHHRGVVLGNHERGADDADQQAEEQEYFKALGQPDPGHREGAKCQQVGIGHPRPDPVAQPADEESRENGHGDRRDDRPANLAFGQAQFVAHDDHQGRDTEPCEKAGKERKPRHVERSDLHHVHVEEISPKAGCLILDFHQSLQ